MGQLPAHDGLERGTGTAHAWVRAHHGPADMSTGLSHDRKYPAQIEMAMGTDLFLQYPNLLIHGLFKPDPI